MINIFVDVLTNDNLHLISITEMWLCNDDIFIMSIVFNFNCNVLRCDRTFRGCGGVLACINSSVPYCLYSAFYSDEGCLEYLAFTLYPTLRYLHILLYYILHLRALLNQLTILLIFSFVPCQLIQVLVMYSGWL